MTTLRQRYIANYLPRLKQFISGVADLPIEELAKIPMPFLPQYGDLYENAPLKLVLIGMETKGWGNVKVFLEGAKRDSAGILFSELHSFRELAFTGFGNNSGTAFWDVMQCFVANVHGIKDWKLLKRRQHDDVLSSFVSANANSVERYEVSAKVKGARLGVWRAVKEASRCFDSGKLILDTFQPDVIFLSTRDAKPAVYFGADVPLVLLNEFPVCNLRVYRIGDSDRFLFWMPHPTWMARNRHRFPKEFYADRIVAVLDELGLRARLPEHTTSPTLDIKNSLRARAIPGTDKFVAIGWIAAELILRNRTMTALELVFLLNDLGIRTNRGTEFTGNGRGPYSLIRAAYHRAKGARDAMSADRIARAFVNVEGQHAWS